MFLTAREMYAAEEAVFATGVLPESLMNEAGEKIASEILRRFEGNAAGRAIAVIGSGNNGADALVALRHLKEAGWKVAIRSSGEPEKLKGLPSKKWQELADVPLLPTLHDLPGSGPFIILDGLLGIGTKGDLREPLATLAGEINDLAEKDAAFIVAVDIPSGLDCDTGLPGENAVKAHLTCTLGSPKAGLISDQAINHVGALALLPLAGLSDWKIGDLKTDHLICPLTLPVEKLHRPFDFHKGQAGRVGIIAGSRGLAGAAALTSRGALRGGAGLITLFVKEQDYPLILPLVPIEVMVRPVKSYREVLDQNLDALALGPGLGEAGSDILSLINQFEAPTVIDADALNLISKRSHLSALKNHHLVTPHPGEMARLLPDLQPKTSRTEIARTFTKRTPATLLFKGARTIVTQRDAPLAYNSTGTPAMATGGQGDVLTGLLAALLARGIPLFEAAKLGAWLTGKSSEIAIQNESTESLSATTTAAYLGNAFNELKSSRS
jgi:NAD(P)H-hydrate epimerase